MFSSFCLETTWTEVKNVENMIAGQNVENMMEAKSVKKKKKKKEHE